MRKLRFFLPFAALGLLASCSNDNMGEPAVEQTPVDGNAMYLSFNLANPPGNRAGETYEEGDASEYTINNVKLYLYKSVSGTTSFYKAYSPILGANTPDLDQDGITSKQEITFQIDDISAADFGNTEFSAFIIVNEGEITGPASDLSTWNATRATATARATKSAVNAGTAVNAMIPVISGTSYFTMTNAPLWDGTNVQTLVPLKKGNFATSPAAAKDAAATVYVQRGVAKVVVKSVDTNGVTVQNTTDKVKFDGWALDVINKNGSMIQVVEDAASFSNVTGETPDWSAAQFLGTNLASTGTLERIFWSKDDNYDSAASGDFLTITSANNQWNAMAETDWEYCMENTMNFKAMTKDATTRIVFKGKYCLGGNDPVSFVWFPGNDKTSKVNDANIADLTTSDITPVNGKYKLADLIKDETELKNVTAALGCDSQQYVYFYPQGVTYYTALIRHFNDDVAALTSDGTSGGTALVVNEVGNYTKFQLGRYGVVRNNTYKVNVSKVFGFGSPDVPPTTPDPDDKPEDVKYNVLLEIDVLDWAVRDGNYELH